MAEPDTGAWDYTFPHVIGRGSLEPDIGFYNAVYDSPLADWYLARFAMAILDNEGLGDDGSPDLLAISFSAADTVGHSYGPNSREVLDVFVRLDRALGELFDFIEREVGMQHVVIGLSADHGVAPLPEVRALQGEAGERRDPSDVLCVQGAGTRLEPGVRIGKCRLGITRPVSEPARRRSGRLLGGGCGVETCRAGDGVPVGSPRPHGNAAGGRLTASGSRPRDLAARP